MPQALLIQAKVFLCRLHSQQASAGRSSQMNYEIPISALGLLQTVRGKIPPKLPSHQRTTISLARPTQIRVKLLSEPTHKVTSVRKSFNPDCQHYETLADLIHRVKLLVTGRRR